MFGELNSSLTSTRAAASLRGLGRAQGELQRRRQALTTLPNPIGYYTDPLIDLSERLAELSPTAGSTFINGNFNAGPNSGMIVFEISGSELAHDLVNHDISFTGSGVTSYIINVIGNFNEPSSTHFNVDQRDALFNFEDASSVNLGQWAPRFSRPTLRSRSLGRKHRGFGVRVVVPRRRRTP